MEVDPSGFRDFVEERGGKGPRYSDLYLVFGCVEQVRKAIASMDLLMGAEVGAACKRLDPSAAFRGEVHQRLREKLLVPAKGQLPRIAGYLGRGPLQKWLKAAATRAALDLLAEQKRSPAEEDLSARVAPPSSDPELAALKRLYAKPFREAFEEAFALLSVQERNVLRMHFLQRLSLEDVGLAYGAHRATVARWIATARAKVLQQTQLGLARRLKVTPSEFGSLVDLVRSQLDVSLNRYLGKSAS